MKRGQRVRDLWSWLPAFRAVAETEHLPSAARALHVSPSSLSRAVALLEADLGRELFDRVGRRIALNDAGREVLSAVRLAMRSVDEAISRVGPGRMVGTITVSVPGPYAPIFVLPALARLAQEHPELRPEVRSCATSTLPRELNTGRVDVALVDGPAPGGDLVVRELAHVEHALCCAPDHPLVCRGALRPEDVAEFRFATPMPLPDGSIPDRWPPAWRRRVGLTVAQMQVAIDACKDGDLLAVLPWPIARRAGLRRLPLPGIPGSTLHALLRPPLDHPTGPDQVLDALAQQARTVAASA